MILTDNLGTEADALYAALMQCHEGLSTDHSHRLNARLVLMMMNEIGDPARLKILLDEARSLSPG